MNKWVDITDQLNEEGQKLSVGQILMFEQGNLKIMRKRYGKVWAKFVVLYRADQVEIVDRVE